MKSKESENIIKAEKETLYMELDRKRVSPTESICMRRNVQQGTFRSRSVETAVGSSVKSALSSKEIQHRLYNAGGTAELDNPSRSVVDTMLRDFFV